MLHQTYTCGTTRDESRGLNHTKLNLSHTCDGRRTKLARPQRAKKKFNVVPNQRRNSQQTHTQLNKPKTQNQQSEKRKQTQTQARARASCARSSSFGRTSRQNASVPATSSIHDPPSIDRQPTNTNIETAKPCRPSSTQRTCSLLVEMIVSQY